jgi:PHD/YefM family antitoxin component YafN of YafNO toxin-antitoxin module
MAILPLRKFGSLKETAYLFGHEANATHLRQSLQILKQGQAKKKKLLND